MKIGVDKLEGEEPLLLMTDIVILRPNAMIKKITIDNKPGNLKDVLNSVPDSKLRPQLTCLKESFSKQLIKSGNR